MVLHILQYITCISMFFYRWQRRSKYQNTSRGWPLNTLKNLDLTFRKSCKHIIRNTYPPPKKTHPWHMDVFTVLLQDLQDFLHIVLFLRLNGRDQACHRHALVDLRHLRHGMASRRSASRNGWSAVAVDGYWYHYKPLPICAMYGIFTYIITIINHYKPL